MKREIKQRWIKALRSGEYEQGEYYLCKDNKYCCLGVLTEINNHFIAGIGGVKYVDEVLTDFLTEEQLKAYVITIKEQDQLATMNDDGKDFDEIADWIAEHVPDTD